MRKTAEGKVLVFGPTGQREYWPVDAKLLLTQEGHSLEPPAGVEVKEPFVPPKHVGVPKRVVAEMFEAKDDKAKKQG